MVNFGKPWKNLHLEGVLEGPRSFLYCLGRKGAGKTNKSQSRSFFMGGIWIETSSDVYFRERNEDKKVFKNIEIWAIIPVPVDGVSPTCLSLLAKARACLSR